VALIKEMARDNRLWGAERIRGELLKLGIRVCKRTIQNYMRQVSTTGPRGQNWKTFLRTHAEQVWACDAPPCHGSLLPLAVRLLHHRTALAQSDPRRREYLDHLLILHEKQLHRVLNAYMHSFNQAGPHQGIKQQIPEQKAGSVPLQHESGKVISFPVLGGLHRDYRRSA
jgi:hypothetical protein